MRQMGWTRKCWAKVMIICVIHARRSSIRPSSSRVIYRSGVEHRCPVHKSTSVAPPPRCHFLTSIQVQYIGAAYRAYVSLTQALSLASFSSSVSDPRPRPGRKQIHTATIVNEGPTEPGVVYAWLGPFDVIRTWPVTTIHLPPLILLLTLPTLTRTRAALAVRSSNSSSTSLPCTRPTGPSSTHSTSTRFG